MATSIWLHIHMKRARGWTMKSCPKEISLAENTLAVASIAPAASTKRTGRLSTAMATTSEWRSMYNGNMCKRIHHLWQPQWTQQNFQCQQQHPRARDVIFFPYSYRFSNLRRMTHKIALICLENCCFQIHLKYIYFMHGYGSFQQKLSSRLFAKWKKKNALVSILYETWYSPTGW